MKKGLLLMIIAVALFCSACQERPIEGGVSPTADESLGANTVYQVVLPGGSLKPDGKYQALEQPKRYYQDTMLYLNPKDDYGRIYPYIGGATSFWGSGTLYGLCDSKGRVICDPVFNGAEVLSDGKDSVYLLSKISGRQAGSDYAANINYTLVAMDGSWKINASDYTADGRIYDFDKYLNYGLINDMFPSDYTPRTFPYISICQNGKWGLVDYQGQYILPCVYPNPLCFSQGLAAIYLNADKSSYAYINLQGKQVLGPYTAPTEIAIPIYGDETCVWQSEYICELYFREGKAVFFQDGLMGFIDRAGGIAVAPQYDFVSGFYDGYALVKKGIYYNVINYKGETLFDAISPTNSEYSAIRYIGDDLFCIKTEDEKYYVNAQGKQADHQEYWDLNYEERQQIGQPLEGSNYSYRESDSGITLIKGDKQYYFANGYSISYWQDDLFILRMCDADDNYSAQIVTGSGQTVFGPLNGWIYAREDILIHDNPDNQTNSYQSTLYNKNYQELGDYNKYNVFDDFITVIQGDYGGVISKDGQWIIKAPLLAYYPD